ncbi:MAG: SGNH/GDSL hydrolase family protein [Candidatus Aenigmatarchaeota archaeon]
MKKDKIFFVLVVVSSITLFFLLKSFQLESKTNVSNRSTFDELFEENYKNTLKELKTRDMPEGQIDYKKRSDIPGVYRELVPNYTGWYDGQRIDLPKVKIDINRDGFRDNLYKKNKDNDTFRIIAIGDSITFARGVNISDSYPKVLERKLNKYYKNKIEVLNFGIPGLYIDSKISLIEHKAIDYEPDLIIYQHFANDLFRNKSMKDLIGQIGERKRKKYKEKHENVTELDLKRVQVAVDMAIHKTFEELNNERNESLEKLDKKLKVLDDLSKKHSFDIAIFTYQCRHYIDNEIREFSNKDNWTYVGVEEFKDDKYKLNKKDPLPNYLAHRAIADRIFSNIKKRI